MKDSVVRFMVSPAGRAVCVVAGLLVGAPLDGDAARRAVS